jgi:two-component sensor histidine kinase
VVENVYHRIFPGGTPPAAPHSDEHRKVLDTQLKAVDLIGERARLNELIVGCSGTDPDLFPKIERTMENLQALSRMGSPIEDRRGHDLFTSLTSAAVDAVLKEISIPAAMSPILMSKGALEAYFSLSSTLQYYLFDYLFSRYSHAIEDARLTLTTPMGKSEGYGDYARAVEYCLATHGGEPMGDFLKKIEKMREDPGFLRAYLKLIELRSELRDHFRGALDMFGAFQRDFSDFVRSIYEVETRENAEIRGMWQYAFSEVDDLLRDADNVLTSLDVTFALLARYEARDKMEVATDVLRSFGISHVPSDIYLAVNINNVRADARNTEIDADSSTDIEVPSYLRVDLFRAVNELLLNSIRNSDLGKSDRTVTVSAKLVDSLLKIKVKDNGPGVKNITGKIAQAEKGGLARVNRIARRRDWRFSMKAREGTGTVAQLSIDTERWASQPPSATGGRHTIQTPDGFRGILGADPERSMHCEYDGIDAEGFPDDYAIATGAIAARQLEGVAVMIPAIVAGARPV